ncbi:MAG: Nickel-dependent lactate racemase [Chloroflexi bacterium]|nr:MAG: Nickel-dependent lactate racemase [Chloroflexota bacterium]
MRVQLAYGDQGLPVDLPDHTDVIEPLPSQPLANVPAHLRAAIAAPIGAPPLADRVGPNDHVTIVFSDNTRPVPNREIAPALLEALAAAGVPDHQITLLVGGGLHEPLSAAQIDTLLGADIARRYRTLAHDARDPDQQIFLQRYPGERRGGIYLNAAFMQATVRIVTGFVEPHLFAGYSGGGKGVFPGVASAHNIMRNHGVANLANDSATYCVTEGNPIFEDVRRIALNASVDFLCNVTLDAHKRVTGVFCGDLIAAHDAAIAHIDRQAVRPIERPYDIVVGSNGGHPADLNLYQSVKGIVAAGLGVRDGGEIVIAAECREGVGSEDYAAFLASAESPQALMEEMLQPDFHRIDSWQVQMQVAVQQRARLSLYSTLDDAAVRAAHLQPVADISATVARLAAAHQRHTEDRTRILALPHGFQAIPRVVPA